MAPADAPANSWTQFWRTVVRFDTGKIKPVVALRNTVGVAGALVGGLLLGNIAGALAAALGALNVCYSDSEEPYATRAQRMLVASVVVSAAVFVGGVVGYGPVVSIVATTTWAFGVGMLVALSTNAGNLGLVSLVTLVVFAATPQKPGAAAVAALLAFCGGVLQIVLSLVFWPLRPYGPERSALADLYAALSRMAASDINPLSPPPATAQTNEAHDAISATARDHSLQSDRLHYLLAQAERIRLTILVLHRLRMRMQRQDSNKGPLQLLRDTFDVASALLHEVSHALRTDRPELAHAPDAAMDRISDSLREAEAGGPEEVSELIRETRVQVAALAGQLRSAIELATSVTADNGGPLSHRVRLPLRFSSENAVVTIRANLHLGSAAFRQAVRLAVCTGAAGALGHALGTVRPYWMPMTVAIILKPDFTATFSRGVLRLGGTYIGLLIATLLFHALPATRASEVALVAALTFVMRWLGPANYGILVVAVSGLVVSLIAITGVPPATVVGARALNTTLGGVTALVAYGLWPTWERRHVSQPMAELLDAYRDYFRTVARSTPDHDRTRAAARLARSNAEASFERLAAEPMTSREKVDALAAMLAGTHRFAHAVMALEAAREAAPSVPPQPEFYKFADDVELTLYYLAAAFRGSPLDREHLPDLREEYHALIHSVAEPVPVHDLVNTETDRIVNSLNTVAEQVLRWKQT